MEFDSGSIPLMLKNVASNMLLAVLNKVCACYLLYTIV